MSQVKRIAKLEWLVFSRSQGQWLYPVMFFVLVLTMFVLGIDPEKERLVQMAPAVIWCAYLLSLLLALDHVWRDDYQSGVLEQLVINSDKPMQFLLLRSLVRWFYSVVPLLLALPLSLLFLQLPLSIVGIAFVALVLGSLCFWLLGSSLAALTLGDKRSSLMSLLLLPFSVPLLVFGSRLIKFAIEGESVAGIIWLFAGLSILAISSTPWIMHSGIKLNLD